MLNLDELPFFNVSDNELINCFSTELPILSLDDLQNMQFENIVWNENTQMQGSDPDNFILTNLGITNPTSNYNFPCASLGNNLNTNSNNSISIISYNINSIPLHLNEFIDQCLSPIDHKFNVIGFCETKLTDQIQRIYNIPNYNAFYNNCNRNSGGVALYVSNQIESQLRPDLTLMENYIETVFVEIISNSATFVIGQIYRRPHTNLESFNEKVQSIVEKIQQENKICVLVGDFNINLFKDNNDSQELISSFNSNFYFNTIT